MSIQTQNFDWGNELHQTILHSLISSFGLDFLLFKDKRGGDVDTILKAREYQKELQHTGQSSIHISQELHNQLDPKGKNYESYDSHAYHSDERYRNHGKNDKNQQNKGELHDAYRNNNMEIGEKRQLDHIISAYEIHNDSGRLLAGLDGISLANQDNNLASTVAYINTKKSKLSVQDFLDKLPEMKKQKIESIQKNQEKLMKMPENTPEERNNKQQIKDQIRKEQEHLNQLESIDPHAMIKKDSQARQNYNQQINWAYYTNSKFIFATTKDMATKGLTMGTRQAIGLILAEFWFEIKEQIPDILRKCRTNFHLHELMNSLCEIFKNTWERIKIRFKDILITFKDGLIGGLLSSITTIIWNTFQTIGGNAIKIIRETWNSLVQAIKLIFFNPKKLSLGDLTREVTRIIGTAAAIAVGTFVNTAMIELLKVIPFEFIKSSLSAFISTLVTGILTMGLSYFLDYSPMMQKIWNCLNSFKSKYERLIEHYKEINAELDRYLLEIAQLEFNLNPLELQIFADSLAVTNNEYEREQILATEIKKRNIELPFEVGNLDSTRIWLSKL